MTIDKMQEARDLMVEATDLMNGAIEGALRYGPVVPREPVADASAAWKQFQRGAPGLVADGMPGAKTAAAALALQVKHEMLAHMGDGLQPDEYSFGGDPIRAGVDRNPGELLPGFARKVDRLFRALRADGHDPMLWEGYRSPERAAKLAKKGTGIKLSMHCLGAAVDIVDEDDMWKATSAFWDAIGNHAEDLGLCVLYNSRGQRIDRPHVQAVSVRAQNKFRAMTPAERARFVE